MVQGKKCSIPQGKTCIAMAVWRREITSRMCVCVCVCVCVCRSRWGELGGEKVEGGRGGKEGNQTRF